MAENKLEVVVSGKDELSPMFQGLESRVIRFVGFISSAIAGVKLATLPVTSAATFERGLADVAKTTNFTKTQINDLSDGLLKLSLTTDVSANDLAKIAAAAGQQGLGKEGVDGVLKFTESVSRMASVLDITAEQAGADVGKILNIFKIPVQEIEKLSSAINLVSNNSTARGRELLDILKRIGDGGGTLKNVQESLTLAATGLDLGVSPEVIGTSYTRILNQMLSKSKEFAQVNKIMVNGVMREMTQGEWVAEVEKSGLKAYLKTLDRIRAMDKVSQAQTINTIFGQGRVFGLSAKGVQDTEDSVIKKNLALAEAGYQSGTSAIKEQATVMNTLIAQTKVLGNSLNKVAIQAGAPILEKLTGYVIELQKAFQGEKFTSFANAAVKALGDIAGKVAETVRFIGDLNINWNNLVTVAKLFVEIKVAQAILGITTRILGMGAAFGSGAAGVGTMTAALLGYKKAQDAVVAGNLAAAAAASGASGSGSGGSAPAKPVGPASALIQQIVERRKAIKEAADAEAELTKKQQALDKARGDQLRAQLNERDAMQRKLASAVEVASTAGKVTKAQDGLQSVASITAAKVDKAKIDAATQVQVAQAAANKAIMTEQARHLAAMTALEAEFWAKDSTLTATELNKRIAAEKAAHAKNLSDQAQANAASIAAAEAAALRRIEIAKFEHDRVVTLSQARVAGTANQANAAIAKDVAAGVGVAAAGATVAAAGAAVGAAKNDVTTAGVNADIANKKVTEATKAIFNFRSIIGLIGSAISGLFRLLGPVAFAISIVYTALDAFGLLDKVPELFRKLTDALGFTSEAHRKEMEASRRAREEMEKRAEKVQELVKAYRDLNDGMLNPATGKLDTDKLQRNVEGLQSATQIEERVSLAKNLGKRLEGSTLDKAETDQQVEALPKLKEQADKDEAELGKKLNEQKAKLADLEARKKDAFNTVPVAVLKKGIEQTTAEVNRLATAYAEAKKRKDTLADVKVEDIQAGKTRRADNADIAANATLSPLFTDASVPVVEALAKKKEAEAAQTEALAKQKKAQDDLNALLKTDAKGTKKEDDARIALKEQENAAKAAAVQVAGLQAAYDKLDESVRAKGDPITIATLDFIKEVLGRLDEEGVKFYDNALKRRQALIEAGTPGIAPLVGGGTGVTKPPKPSSGTEGGLPNEAELAEARKMARAVAEFNRQTLIARFNFEKEQNDQLQAESERAFAKGLRSLSDYYSNRAAITKKNLQAEITLKQNEIDNKKEERKDPAFKDADRKRIDAEIVALEGQKRVLTEKLKEIPKQLAQDIQLAIKQFNEQTLSEGLDIVRLFGITDVSAAFGDQLTLLESQLEFRLNALKQNLGKKGINLTPEFIKNFQISGVLKAADSTFNAIAEHARVAADKVNAQLSRISFQQQRGQITDVEAERARNDANAAQAENVVKDIKAREEALKSMTDALVKKERVEGEADEAARLRVQSTLAQTDAYQKQVQEIENLKDTYIQLKTVTDDVARSINEGFGGAITKLIEDLGEKSTGKLRTFFQNLNKVVLAEAQKMFVQDFVKKMEVIGGPGGFFSKLLNPQGTGGKQGPQPVSKDMLGRTENDAMWVRIKGQPEQPKDSKADQGKPVESSGAKTESVPTPDVQTRDLEKAVEAGTKKANEAYKLPGATNEQGLAYLNDPANRKNVLADAENIGRLRTAQKTGQKPADDFDYEKFRKATLDANSAAAKSDPLGRSEANPDHVKLSTVDKAELAQAVAAANPARPPVAATPEKPLSDAEAASAAAQSATDARQAVDTSAKDVGEGVTGLFSKLGNDAKNGGLGINLFGLGLVGALSVVFSKGTTAIQKFAAVATPILGALISNKAFTDGLGKTMKGLFGGDKPKASEVTIPETSRDALTPSIDDLMNNAVPKVGEAVDKVGETITQEAAKVATDITAPGTGIDGLFSTLGTGLTDGLAGLGDSAADLFAGLGDTFGDLFSGLGDSLSGMGEGLSGILSGIFGGAGGAGGGDMFASLATLFLHTGGVVGQDGAGWHAPVSPLAFAGAIRYHTGGVAGLQPNEVPAILQKGEEVLTASDPRHRKNNGRVGGGGGGSPVINFNVSTPDANSFRKSKDQVSAQTGQAVNRALRRNM